MSGNKDVVGVAISNYDPSGTKFLTGSRFLLTAAEVELFIKQQQDKPIADRPVCIGVTFDNISKADLLQYAPNLVQTCTPDIPYMPVTATKEMAVKYINKALSVHQFLDENFALIDPDCSHDMVTTISTHMSRAMKFAVENMNTPPKMPVFLDDKTEVDSSSEETDLEAKDVLEQLESNAREICEILQIVRSGNGTGAELVKLEKSCQPLEREVKEASTRTAASQGEAQDKMQHLKQKLLFRDKFQKEHEMQEKLRAVKKNGAIQDAFCDQTDDFQSIRSGQTSLEVRTLRGYSTRTSRKCILKLFIVTAQGDVKFSNIMVVPYKFEMKFLNEEVLNEEVSLRHLDLLEMVLSHAKGKPCSLKYQQSFILMIFPVRYECVRVFLEALDWTIMESFKKKLLELEYYNNTDQAFKFLRATRQDNKEELHRRN